LLTANFKETINALTRRRHTVAEAPVRPHAVGLREMMNKNDLIQLREWKQLQFNDPVFILKELRMLELQLAGVTLAEEVRTLRTGGLKVYREGRDAALFCLGMAKITGNKVYFALHESQDYDFVTVWQCGDELNYTPVQLKEVVRDSLNPNANVNATLQKLTKYHGSNRTTAAVIINREMRLEFSKIHFPEVQMGGVWIYGTLSPDQSRWFIYGDLQKEPLLWEYEYPSDPTDVTA
jgi:hypothetical protein